MSSQNRSYGQVAIKGGGGILYDGSFSAQVGIEKHIALSRHFLTFELSLLSKSSDIYSDKLNLLTTNLNICYNYNIVSKNRFSISGGAGISAGIVSKTSQLGYINIETQTTLSLGPVVNICLDYSITQSLGLFLQPQFYCDFMLNTSQLSLNSSIKNNTLLLIGLKYNL